MCSLFSLILIGSIRTSANPKTRTSAQAHNSTSEPRERGITQSVCARARACARRLGCEAAEAAPRVLPSVACRAAVHPVGAAEPARQDRPPPVRLALRLRGAAHGLQLVDLHLGRRDDGSPAPVAVYLMVPLVSGWYYVLANTGVSSIR